MDDGREMQRKLRRKMVKREINCVKAEKRKEKNIIFLIYFTYIYSFCQISVSLFPHGLIY